MQGEEVKTNLQLMTLTKGNSKEDNKILTVGVAVVMKVEVSFPQARTLSARNNQRKCQNSEQKNTEHC